MEILDPGGRKGLVVGIANEHSLAWSAAQHFRNAGAELAITCLNDDARPFVEPLTKEVDAREVGRVALVLARDPYARHYRRDPLRRRRVSYRGHGFS